MKPISVKNIHHQTSQIICRIFSVPGLAASGPNRKVSGSLTTLAQQTEPRRPEPGRFRLLGRIAGNDLPRRNLIERFIFYHILFKPGPKNPVRLVGTGMAGFQSMVHTIAKPMHLNRLPESFGWFFRNHL